MYQLLQEDGEDFSIRRTADGACIPFDERNRDYQAYLAWVADDNTAEIVDINEEE